MPIVFAKPVLPPVWDISTCNFVSSYSLTGEAERPMGMDFNNDGTKAYIVSDQNNAVEQFSLSTPYVFSSGSVTHDVGEELDISAETTGPQGGAFSTQGDFYHLIAITGVNNPGRRVNQYDLTADWDISTGNYNGAFYQVNNTINGASDLASPAGLTFSDDGARMFVTDGGTGGINGIYQFDLGVHWNITTAVYNGVMVTAELGANGYSGIKFSPNGMQMFVTQRGGADVIRYDLSQAWNIATATYVPPECDASDDSFIMGLAFNPDGTEMYVCGFANNIISKYTL